MILPNQKMEVVWHETVAKNSTAIIISKPFQPFKVLRVILIIAKNRLFSYTSIKDVVISSFVVGFVTGE